MILSVAYTCRLNILVLKVENAGCIKEKMPSHINFDLPTWFRKFQRGRRNYEGEEEADQYVMLWDVFFILYYNIFILFALDLIRVLTCMYTQAIILFKNDTLWTFIYILSLHVGWKLTKK